MAEGDDPLDIGLGGILGTQYTNPEMLDKATQRVAGALSAARAQRDAARAAFGKDVGATVQGLDETTASLKRAHDEQINLPLLAFSAGMLKTTPGVRSNFLGELGSGMESAVPAIAAARARDQDFYSRIADMTRQRGELASQPDKFDLAQADKEIDRLQQNATALETAGIRGVPVQQRLAEQARKTDLMMQAKRQDQLTKMQNEARNDAKELLKNFEATQPQDVEALTQTLLHDRIQRYNQQPGQSIKLDVPDVSPEMQQRAMTIQSGLTKKGGDEYRAKLRGQLLDKANNTLKMTYPAFSSLSPEEQEALRQEELSKQIENNNKGVKPTDDPYMPPMVFSPQEWESINAAKAHQARLLNIGTPPKEEIESNHLPVDMAPTGYANLSYKERQNKLARDEESSKKEMQTLTANAQQLADRTKLGDEYLSNYDATKRHGFIGGQMTALGSDAAQTADKLSAQLAFSNVPQGQGSISDAERSTLQKAIPSRSMERGAIINILNTYKELAQRSNEQLQFFEKWRGLYHTTDGAMAAWNEYINSPQGTILNVDNKTGAITPNPRRMTATEYFDRKNKGDLNTAPAARYERGADGRLHKVEE